MGLQRETGQREVEGVMLKKNKPGTIDGAKNVLWVNWASWANCISILRYRFCRLEECVRGM